MLLPLTKQAGVVGSAIKVLSHPATTVAATVAPVAASMMQKQQPQAPKIAHLLPTLKHAFIAPLIARAAPLLAPIGRALTSPAASAAMNVASLVPLAMGNKQQPNAGQPARSPQGTQQTTGGFSQPMTKLNAVTTADDSADTTQMVTPVAPVPSTRGNPAMGTDSAGSSPGSMPTTSAGAVRPQSTSAKPGASKAFKVGGWLDSPKLTNAMNLASQAAVIGSAAVPFYQLYAEHKRQRDEAMDPAAELRAIQTAQQARPVVPDASPDLGRKIAAMLPLQPKRPLLERLNEGVKDFGEGAFNALDSEAGKLLAPSTHLDPATHRIPSLSHII